MKKFYKFISILCLIVILLPLSPVQAKVNTNLKSAEINYTKNIDSKEGIKSISIDDIDKVTVENSYTYEEILKDQLNLNLISVEKYNNLMKQEKLKEKAYSLNKASSLAGVRYQKFNFKEYRFNSGLFGYYSHVLIPVVYAGVDFDYQGVPKGIVSIEEPHIYTGDGAKCIFGGKIFYKLENYKSIYLGVYGDVYSTGTTTISGGAKIGIGKSSSVSISFSHSDTFLKNIDFERRKVISTPY